QHPFFGRLAQFNQRVTAAAIHFAAGLQNFDRSLELRSIQRIQRMIGAAGQGSDERNDCRSAQPWQPHSPRIAGKTGKAWHPGLSEMILEWLSNLSWAAIIAGPPLARHQFLNSLPDCPRFRGAVGPHLINSGALERIGHTL